MIMMDNERFDESILLLLPPASAKHGLSGENLHVINTLSLKKLNNAQKITSKY